MRRFNILVLELTIFCNISIFAQSNFVHGTIVTNKEDTLVGFINNQQWIRNPHFFEFKKDSIDIIQLFDVNNANYVSFYNNEYIAAKVYIDKESNKIDRLKNINARLQPEYEKVFLQTLFLGKVSLFYYIDEYNKEHFYIQKDTSTYDELIYYKYILSPNSAKVNKLVKTVETYKGQLIY